MFISIKIDLVLNNLKWLICHKIKTNQSSLAVKFNCGLTLVGRIWALSCPSCWLIFTHTVLFYKDGFGITLLTKVDIPINQTRLYTR